MTTAAELDALIEELTVDVYGDEEQLSSFLVGAEEAFVRGEHATIAGTPVEVTSVDCGPDARTGLTARVARSRLSDVETDGVASAVTAALLALDQEDLAANAGRTRYGYVEPTEAAWSLLEAAVEPWLEDIARRASLGLLDAARHLGLGILEALDRIDQHTRNDDLLVFWAPDFAAETADRVTQALADAGVDLTDAGLARRAERDAASLLPVSPHTHNALDDAIEQGELFANVFEWVARRRHSVVHAPRSVASQAPAWLASRVGSAS